SICGHASFQFSSGYIDKIFSQFQHFDCQRGLVLLWKMENLSMKKRLGLEVDKQQSYGFSFNF
ncbi:hypothetical protein MUO71_01930, partial [Candidatus Bathyarchaeota archaeon]|nr:hypothetical protein [Candidatus Bathyarchaeota archaeon]